MGVLLVIYSVIFVMATWLAYGLRFDFVVPLAHQTEIGRVWIWIWVFKLIALAVAGQFSSLLSFFSLPDLRRLGVALGVVSAGVLGAWYVLEVMKGMPRVVILLDGILSFLGLSMCRLGFRLIRESSGNGTSESAGRRVGIVGAGEVGAALARELQTKETMVPVIFFDDSDTKKGTQVHGIPVTGSVEVLREEAVLELDEVIIAMPSAPGQRVREVVALMDELGIRCRTVPAMSQIALGEIVTNLRPVEIGDVLGREQVNLELDRLHDFFAGKTVMVTGAGGSIGSELCRQLAGLKLGRLVLVDRSEFGLFEIESELKGSVEVFPALVDVQDEPAMDDLLEHHPPAIVFHAAALKHVTMMERQPAVAIRNNVLATHQLAAQSEKHGVGHFILISTDKAVNPTSVMGATKLIAEQLIQGHALEKKGATRFITVRFGNVLGSSGSVVPIFQRQIEQGGPVTVTDPKATRFFMSIPEAAGLVLRSAAMGENGDRVILDMGEPVSIVKLAEEMIRLSGKTREEVAIDFIGLAPGEKLHELLHTGEEKLTDTAHSKIKRIEGAALTDGEWDRLRDGLREISELNRETAPSWLKTLIPGFDSD